MKDLQKAFMHDQVWSMTIGAAFQRANIYKKGCTDEQKTLLKNHLLQQVQSIAKPYYQGKVTEDQHLSNIWLISTTSSEAFPEILNENGFIFGVSQKLLNLYLKYLWCLGDIPEPPHFPVDRIIQVLLKVPVLHAWTKMKEEKPYTDIIKHARTVLKERPDVSSLAHLELDLYNNRK